MSASATTLIRSSAKMAMKSATPRSDFLLVFGGWFCIFFFSLFLEPSATDWD
jgi:hypothetical protein